MGIFNYANAPLIVTIIMLITILGTFLFIKRNRNSKNRITEQFMEQLDVMSGKEVSSSKKAKLDIGKKWNDIWGNSLKKAGWISKDIDNQRVGFLVASITGIFYLLVTLISRNIGIALMPIIAVYMFLYLFLEKAIEDREEIFNEQVPIFLSVFKANIRAGETAIRALSNAIDETDSPLYDELKPARALIDVGSFQSAIEKLRRDTESEALRFLCGCIELSTVVGANLEHQVEIIEEMLDSNRQLKRKLKVAISKNTPLVILSAILIPAVFLFTYIFNEQTRAFWFKTPLSWVAFVLTMGIYLGGVFLAKKVTKKTGKF